MSQYNKTVRMLFGVIAFLLFSKVSIMLGTTGWKDVCFLIGCYLFLYFFYFLPYRFSCRKNIIIPSRI